MPLEIKINPVGSIEVEEGGFYVSIREKYREALRELRDKNLLFGQQSIKNFLAPQYYFSTDTSTTCCACISGCQFKSR